MSIDATRVDAKLYLYPMKFFGRQEELESLKKIRLQSEERGRMTVITGRRRVGKTRLILESLSGETFLYFFVSRKNERLLCEQFCEQITEVLGVPIYQPIEDFRNVFQFILELAHHRHINLVIDEFQEFLRINPSVYSDMQNFWDRNKESIRMNLVLSGSVQSLMIRIFDSYQEPLFGRATAKIFVRPLRIGTIRKMMESYFPTYTPEDLLALYTFTGGIPHYLEAFADEGNLAYGSMLDQMLDQQSFFLAEGKFLLIQEFGKDYATYFSILALIATGKTTRGKIESVLQKPIGGYLTNLQKDYRIINRLRPMFSKEGTTNVRYYIDDNFLNFWFRFFYRNDVALESRNFAFVRKKIDRDYSTFAGGVLEKFIRQQLTETLRFSTVGNYWERGNKNEIDVIAFNELSKEAVIGEIKLNPKYISIDDLKAKAHTLTKKNLKGFDIEYRAYSLADVMNDEL